jgi:hypothetical protein
MFDIELHHIPGTKLAAPDVLSCSTWLLRRVQTFNLFVLDINVHNLLLAYLLSSQVNFTTTSRCTVLEC